jgi:hypothetical protein
LQQEPALSAARVQPLAGTDLTISRTLLRRKLVNLRMGWNCQSVYD